MRHALMAALLIVGLLPAAAPAHAGEVKRVEAAQGVAATMDALVAAVEGAGATVFARVNHAGGAESVGMVLAPAELLIFGNPKLGTPAMQDDIAAGIFLPLRVLVYEDEGGKAWLAYEDPAGMLSPLEGIGEDAAYLGLMSGALAKLTAKAAGG